MRKETITYKDFNNVERTEDFYFNLTEAEVMEMEMSVDGGFAEQLTQIANSKKAPEIIKAFKDFLFKAYGEKSADGRRFVKSEEISAAFSHTKAYSKLFMKLATDAKYAADFINAVVPNAENKQQ
jgi:hypothetical protein